MRHLTTFVAVTCLMVVAPPIWIAAQEEADSATEFEIGVLFGLRHYWADGKDLTLFTIPGDVSGRLSSVPLYVALFPSPAFVRGRRRAIAGDEFMLLVGIGTRIGGKNE